MIDTTKVYELQKHLSETAHGRNTGPILVTAKFLDSLPGGLQQATMHSG